MPPLLALSAAKSIQKSLTIAKKPAAVLESWRQWLSGKDVAGVILPSGLKTISAKGQAAIRMMKPIMLSQAGEQGKSVAAMFDVYADLLQAVEKEVTTVGIALELDKQSVLRLTKRLLLVPGGHVRNSWPSGTGQRKIRWPSCPTNRTWWPAAAPSPTRCMGKS